MPVTSPAGSPESTAPAGPPCSELELIGCKAVPMTYEQYCRYESRLEVWDAETETAWMVREPTSADHESPSHGLAGLTALIAAVRGSPIACYGSMDLLVRDARGKPRRIMQGGPDGVPASVAGGAVGRRVDGGGAAQLPGRGAGGGPHDGRAAGEVEAVRGVGVPGAVGGGAGAAGTEPCEEPDAGAHDSSAGGRCLPDVAGERGISRLAGGGHPRGDERGRAFGADQYDSGTSGPEAGGAGRDGAGQRLAAAFPAGSESGRRAWRKAGRRWCARCCCLGASRFRRGSRPPRRRSPHCPRRPSSRRRSPATASGTSTYAWPASAVVDMQTSGRSTPDRLAPPWPAISSRTHSRSSHRIHGGVVISSTSGTWSLRRGSIQSWYRPTIRVKARSAHSSGMNT